MKRLALLFLALTSVRAETPTAYRQDFSQVAVGDPPEPELFVVEGAFQVTEKEGNKALAISPLPLVEGGVLFGPSSKGAATVSAKILGTKTRRSFPRFGVGLHGVSGYRLLVTPAKKTVELVKEEQTVASAPFEWKAGAWCQLKFRAVESDGQWRLEGWAWTDGDKQPEKPTISHSLDAAPGQGKASVWGAPYSGVEILFDDLQAEAAPAKD